MVLWLAASSGCNRSNAALLSVTLTDPASTTGGYFGWAIAAVGTEHVVIGAYEERNAAREAGTAYLFGTNGALVTTFTNPTPARFDWFGFAVAAVGSDKVLIGSYGRDLGEADAGAAYLFGTNGALLVTFTNPTPTTADYFGKAVTAVGADRVLIGALAKDGGAMDARAAYLFSTNGSLLTTFFNPSPATSDYFGHALAAVGDKVLIGAYLSDTGATNTGAAYLFDTNGALITMFTTPNPALSDLFGYAVAAFGPDRVLIGAYQGDFGATDAGAAYLFNTNGTLITTFTNPTPAAFEYFGRSVTAVGTDRVLVGAHYESSGAAIAGAAYLFDTNGTLLTTLTNPAPQAGDRFGGAVVAVNADTVLIGAYGHADYTGAAYLFNLTEPREFRLAIEPLVGGTIRICWPLAGRGFLLQHTSDLITPSWRPVPRPYQTNATDIGVTVTPAGSRFFRLYP